MRDVFRELRAVVSGEEGKTRYAGTRGRSSMKTLSGIFALVVSAVIVTLLVVSWFFTYRMVPHQKSNQDLFLHIGIDTIFKTEYVYWTSEEAFDAALDKVCGEGGTYKIKALKSPDAKPISNYHPCPNIKITKLTKNKGADDAATQESAASDPNVTSKIAAVRGDGIKTVLDALATPTPAP